MQAEAGVGVPDFARIDELDARHRHRVQLAFDVAAPEIEEPVQHRKIRCEIHVLPDEALQDARVIGQAINNLCRGQVIVAKLQTQVLGAGYLGHGGVWHGDVYLKGGGDPTFAPPNRA